MAVGLVRLFLSLDEMTFSPFVKVRFVCTPHCPFMFSISSDPRHLQRDSGRCRKVQEEYAVMFPVCEEADKYGSHTSCLHPTLLGEQDPPLHQINHHHSGEHRVRAIACES